MSMAIIGSGAIGRALATRVGKRSEGGRLQQFGGALTLKNLVQYPVPGR